MLSLLQEQKKKKYAKEIGCMFSMIIYFFSIALMDYGNLPDIHGLLVNNSSINNAF